MAVTRVGDPVRLEAVRRSGMIDSAPELFFDELTRAAARLLRSPLAFMTAVDSERSHWKSSVGVNDGTRSNAVEDSFCQYVIERGHELIVDDTASNDITRSNPSIESMGVRAWAGCPVVVEEQIIGTFCVVDTVPRQWTNADRALLSHLATLASREVTQRTELASAARSKAAAVDRADRAEDLLDAIRVSLLPHDTPKIPSVELATWYQPAHDGYLLLGDFYDAFPLDLKRWAIIVGDVCGHGARAARLTAMIRYTLRSALIYHDDPAAAIADLDRAIRTDPINDDRFATLCVFVLTPDGDHLDVVHLRAGHPYPIWIGPDNPPQLLDGPSGPPVGIFIKDTAWTSETTRLGPTDKIVAYTDGAIECLGPDGTMIGHEGLLALLDQIDHPTSSNDALQLIRHHIRAATIGLGDDVLALAFGPAKGNH